MSKYRKQIKPLKKYTGPDQAFTVNGGRNAEDGNRGEGDPIYTSIVVDHPDFLDAIRIYSDGEVINEVYVDLANARRLVRMLTRDVALLKRIHQIDPEGGRR